MQYVLSLSYGKDSMACLGAIKHLGWPLDRIVTADPPPMVAFKAHADELIWQEYGIRVEHYTTRYAEGITGDRVSYEECFYREMTSGKFVGRIKGFPMQKGNWCTKLKLNALAQIEEATEGCIQYLGIAADEPKRIARHIKRPDVMLPLVELGWEEDLCGLWCKYSGLLSPTYETSTRGGCWFCHNQGVDQLRQLRHTYPDLWEILLKWDADSPVTFKAPSRNTPGRSVHDFDRRFRLEDDGWLLPGDKKFKWAMLDDNIQMKLF